MSWYVSRDGRVSQPMPDAEFAACLKAGRLLDGDHVWSASLRDWMPVADFRRTPMAARIFQALDPAVSPHRPAQAGVTRVGGSAAYGDVRGEPDIAAADFVARLASALDRAQSKGEHAHEPTLVFRLRHLVPLAAPDRPSVGDIRNTSKCPILVLLLSLTLGSPPCSNRGPSVSDATLARPAHIDGQRPTGADGGGIVHQAERTGIGTVPAVAAPAGPEAIVTAETSSVPAVAELLSTWQSGWSKFYKGSHAQATQAVGALRAAYLDPMTQVIRTRLGEVNLPLAELRGSVDQITTEGLAESVANLLDRSFQDLSVEDLMTESRLGNLAECTFDTLPTSARWTISLTLGREAYRSHVVRILSSLRDYIDDDDLNSKPADVVRRYMRSGAMRHRADAMTDQLRCEVKRQIEEDVIPALSQRAAGSAVTS